MPEISDPKGPTEWAYADRANGTARWNRANVLNLMRPSSGAEEYQTIGQRTAFYDWFDQIREAQGHETLWPAAAMIVASQMKNLEDPIRTAAMTARRTAVGVINAGRLAYGVWRVFELHDATALSAGVRVPSFKTSSSLIAFGKSGNKKIFDDVFPRLADLFKQGLAGKPLKGDAAAAWDRETLHHEQFDVVQPIYVQAVHTAPDLKDELTDLAGGHDVFLLGGVAIGFRLDFKGDIMSAQDRYNHGMNVVVPFYRQFKAAIDGGRMRYQTSKPDPSAGGMLRAGT